MTDAPDSGAYTTEIADAFWRVLKRDSHASVRAVAAFFETDPQVIRMWMSTGDEITARVPDGMREPDVTREIGHLTSMFGMQRAMAHAVDETVAELADRLNTGPGGTQ